MTYRKASLSEKKHLMESINLVEIKQAQPQKFESRPPPGKYNSPIYHAVLMGGGRGGTN